VSPGEEITLRPVTEADEEFLVSVYSSTRAAEMALQPGAERNFCEDAVRGAKKPLRRGVSPSQP
jgi:hypothetical protein